MAKNKVIQKEYPSVTKYISKKKKQDFLNEKIVAQVEQLDNVSIEVGKDATNFKKEFELSEKNLKFAKQLLRKSSELNLEKDLKIKQLQQKNENEERELLFENYKEHFEFSDLVLIRSVAPGLSNDSGFVLKILRSLYKNDEAKLGNRSATGRKYKGEVKQEVSFEKKKIIENMLIERLKHELQDKLGISSEFGLRIGKLNRLLRSGIYNIVTKIKCSDKNKNSYDVQVHCRSEYVDTISINLVAVPTADQKVYG